MQSFIEDNWTSAKARHQAMPTASNHWTRAQMKHSSMLAVASRPTPAGSPKNQDEVAVDVFIRRNKLSDAWIAMQSCETDLWTDVCDLWHLCVAVDRDPTRFEGLNHIFNEVAEAKACMEYAELLRAVEIIEEYNQEEWKTEQAPACVRRGSLLMVHETPDHNEHHTQETPLDSRVRHFQHAAAWQKMKTAEKDKWAAACLYHEEQNKFEQAKREKLDAACWVLQDFNTKAWTHDIGEEVRTKARRASILTEHEPSAPDECNDPAYETHRKRALEAWDVMKATDPKEWQTACKKHEDFIMEGSVDVVRKHASIRNGVGTQAA